MTSNNNRNQWLDDLIRDSGGWGGAGLGTVMTLYGAFMGIAAFLIVGPFLIVAAALLSIVGWLRSK